MLGLLEPGLSPRNSPTGQCREWPSVYGRVQLASGFGKRLRAAISCHLTQSSKESA